MEEHAQTDALIDDILSQIHKREMDLQAEHARLVEIVRTLSPGRIETRRISSEIIAAPTNGHRATVRTPALTKAATEGSLVLVGDTRSMSDAARRRLSRRMKAMWRDRKAKGYRTLSRKK